MREGVLEARLGAAPVDDAANDELLRRIAKALGLPRGSVRLIGGERSRDKRIAVEGADSGALRALGAPDRR